MLKYSKIHRLMVFVMALIIVLNIAGCSEKKPNTIIKPEQVVPSVENNDVPDEQPEFLKNVYPTSIRITNTETVLKPGKYKLKAEVSPENAIKGCRFSLVENCSYAQITDDLLIIGKDAPENARITIKASSKYDPQISSTKMFTVSNEIDWIDIATEEQLFAISDNLKGNYRLVNDIYLTKPWVGIGIADTTVDGKKNSGKGFSGRLDGSGFTVYGLDMTDGKGYNKAFFYQIEDGAIIENLSLKGAVHGSSWCGALVGINKGLIKNCLTSVEVKTAAAPCAAFVGTNKGTILNCLALGSATAGYSSAGHGAGFVNVNEGTIKYSYALADTIEFVDGYKKKVYGAILKSEADLKSKVTYSEWDDNVWYIVSGAYPCLRHDGFVPGNNDNNDSNKKPDDNENVIWTDISTEDELRRILNDLNGNYRLTSDIKLTKAWSGIGKPASGSDKGVSFNGRFNGNGYSISGFSMEDPNGFNMGFFMQTGSEAIIEKVKLEGTVKGRNYCSALVGINNGVVKNCIVNVAVSGKSVPSSGFVGTNNGMIAYCLAVGSVSVVNNGKHGAGFVNTNHATKGKIVSSYALDSSMPYAIGYNMGKNTDVTKTDAELKTADTYKDWDSNIWYISNGAYPIFRTQVFRRALNNQCIDFMPEQVAGGFLDDFSCGISMDLWNISKRKWGSLEGYKGALPENLSYTNDGVLRLKAQGNASSDIPLSGAVLVSKQTCGAGSYSICMKSASVLGVCNAMWTFCYGDAGAINHEIDIELPGHITDKSEGTVGSDIGYHRILTTNWLSLNNKTSVGTKLANPANDGDWHVYRFDWHTEPESYIDFFVDGNRINTSRTNVPTKKGLLWFGIWLPKEWCGLPDFDNAYMSVDWISYQPFDEHTEDSICDPGKIADISEYPSMESTIS